MLHVTGVLYFHHFPWVLLPPAQCILSIPPGPWPKMKWVKDHDWMNSLVILRLAYTRRWVLALQLPSIWLLSVQFNLRSALTWPVSITLALGGRYVSLALDSLLSADAIRHAHGNATRSWRSTHHMSVVCMCSNACLQMRLCVWLETGQTSACGILTWGSYSRWNLTVLVHQKFQCEDLSLRYKVRLTMTTSSKWPCKD